MILCVAGELGAGEHWREQQLLRSRVLRQGGMAAADVQRGVCGGGGNRAQQQSTF
jgi:hypothetical protein